MRHAQTTRLGVVNHAQVVDLSVAHVLSLAATARRSRPARVASRMLALRIGLPRTKPAEYTERSPVTATGERSSFCPVRNTSAQWYRISVGGRFGGPCALRTEDEQMQGASQPSGRRTKASPPSPCRAPCDGGTLSLDGVQLRTTSFRPLLHAGHGRTTKASPDP